MKLSFQQENDILLNYILETSLIKKIKENNALNFKENQELTNVNDYYIELNITPVCNQKCNYCYLVKYGNELYPPEIRGEENILNNLKIYLDYLIESKINPYRFDLFSGEIWGMEFSNKIFDILLEYIDNKNLKTKFIMIPSNMSFLINENATKIIQNYINSNYKIAYPILKNNVKNKISYNIRRIFKEGDHYIAIIDAIFNDVEYTGKLKIEIVNNYPQYSELIFY